VLSERFTEWQSTSTSMRENISDQLCKKKKNGQNATRQPDTVVKINS
jgi:hypothetical protein